MPPGMTFGWPDGFWSAGRSAGRAGDHLARRGPLGTLANQGRLFAQQRGIPDLSLIQDSPRYIDNAAFAVAMAQNAPEYLVYYQVSRQRRVIRVFDVNRTWIGIPAFLEHVYPDLDECLNHLVYLQARHVNESGAPLGPTYGFYENQDRVVILPTSFSQYSTPRIYEGVLRKDEQMRQIAGQMRDVMASVLISLVAGRAIQAGMRGVNYAIDRLIPTPRMPESPAPPPPPPPPRRPVSREVPEETPPPREPDPVPPPRGPAVTDAASAARARNDLAFANQAVQNPETIYHHEIRLGGLREIAQSGRMRAGGGTSMFGGGDAVRAYFGPIETPGRLPAVEFTSEIPASARPYGASGNGASWSAEGASPRLPHGDLPIRIRKIVYPDGAMARPVGNGQFELTLPNGTTRTVPASELPGG